MAGDAFTVSVWALKPILESAEVSQQSKGHGIAWIRAVSGWTGLETAQHVLRLERADIPGTEPFCLVVTTEGPGTGFQSVTNIEEWPDGSPLCPSS